VFQGSVRLIRRAAEFDLRERFASKNIRMSETSSESRDRSTENLEGSEDGPDESIGQVVDLEITPSAPPPETLPEEPSEFGARRTRRWLWFALLAALCIFGSSVLFSGGFNRAVGLWWIVKADQCYREDDLDGALNALNRAAARLPDDALIYDNRGQVRLELNDLTGALEDYNELIDLNPDFFGGYAGRGAVYQRLGRFREAIDDFTRAIALRPESDPTQLNNRAYARALGNMELEAGMADIEKALELANEANAAYLDTRGYLHYRLGHYDAALEDLNEAVALSESEAQRIADASANDKKESARGKRLERLAREELAVLLHHRSLVHAALGNEEQAADDARRAEELGFDPERGDF